MTTSIRVFFAERKRIVELAAKYRLPAIYSNKEYVDEGGLMSYGEDVTDRYRRAAGYVDKILKGAKPGDLPVQQATKLEFVVNLKAAKQIGLTLSPDNRDNCLALGISSSESALVNTLLTDNHQNIRRSLRGDVKARRVRRQVAVEVSSNPNVTELERSGEAATQFEGTVALRW